MGKMDEVRALRASQDVHYNCSQSVFIPFAMEHGIDKETAFALSRHFGSGMGFAGVCGALTGALMVMGLKGATAAQCQELIRTFREMHGGVVDCADLLRIDKEKGNTNKKAHCDGLVYDAVQALEKILEEK